jgi:hypothetical protein
MVAADTEVSAPDSRSVEEIRKDLTIDPVSGALSALLPEATGGPVDDATEETDVNSVANALNLEILGSANGVYVVRNEDGEVSELTAGDLFASVEDLGRVPEEDPEYLQNLETEYQSLLDRIADPSTSENERTVLENRKRVLEERYDSNLLLSNLSYPNLQSRVTRGALDLAGNIGSKLGLIKPETAINLLDQADAVVVPEAPEIKLLEAVRAAEAGEAEVAPEAGAKTVTPEVVTDEVVTDEVVTPEVAPAEVAPAKANPLPPEIVPEIQTDIAEDPGDANKITADALLDSAGVDTSNMSVKDQTVAMKKMLSDLMGQTDEDEKEQFWMNMAMVGFGIASGESSDAMKNIADGLLAGTAQISKNTADKKARDDKFTLTAFGEVLADERAREKFGRDLELAGVRATKDRYGARRDPLTQMYMLAKEMYSGGDADYDTYQEALAAARAQVAADYKIDMGGDDASLLTTKATHQQLNDAAKTSGLTEYTGPDGENYKVQ